MERVDNFGRWLVKYSGLLGVFIMLIMMMFTVSNVFMRFFFNSPIKGSIEIIRTLIVFVIFLTIGWSALRKVHVSLDLISQLFSNKAQKAFDAINYIVVMVFSLLIAWQTILQAQLAKAMNLGTMLLKIPRYPLLLVTAYGFILMFIAAAIHLYCLNKDRRI